MAEMDVKRLLLLRKVTRAIAQSLRGQLEEHLAALLTLIRPKSVLGDYVTGRVKESPGFADKMFAELVTQYQGVAESKGFDLARELKPPLEINISPLELTPVEYIHQAESRGEQKAVTVTSPLQWVLSFPGCSPHRLRELVAERQPAADRVQSMVVHYVVLDFMLRKQPGFGKILSALRFPVVAGKLADFPALPVNIIRAPVSTERPPDAVIVENTEISGSNSFEEVVRLEDISALRDEMREQLTAIVAELDPALLPGAAG